MFIKSSVFISQTQRVDSFSWHHWLCLLQHSGFLYQALRQPLFLGGTRGGRRGRKGSQEPANVILSRLHDSPGLYWATQFCSHFDSTVITFGLRAGWETSTPFGCVSPPFDLPGFSGTPPFTHDWWLIAASSECTRILFVLNTRMWEIYHRKSRTFVQRMITFLLVYHRPVEKDSGETQIERGGTSPIDFYIFRLLFRVGKHLYTLAYSQLKAERSLVVYMPRISR